MNRNKLLIAFVLLFSFGCTKNIVAFKEKEFDEPERESLLNQEERQELELKKKKKIKEAKQFLKDINQLTVGNLSSQKDVVIINDTENLLSVQVCSYEKGLFGIVTGVYTKSRLFVQAGGILVLENFDKYKEDFIRYAPIEKEEGIYENLSFKMINIFRTKEYEKSNKLVIRINSPFYQKAGQKEKFEKVEKNKGARVSLKEDALKSKKASIFDLLSIFNKDALSIGQEAEPKIDYDVVFKLPFYSPGKNIFDVKVLSVDQVRALEKWNSFFQNSKKLWEETDRLRTINYDEDMQPQDSSEIILKMSLLIKAFNNEFTNDFMGGREASFAKFIEISKDWLKNFEQMGSFDKWKVKCCCLATHGRNLCGNVVCKSDFEDLVKDVLNIAKQGNLSILEKDNWINKESIFKESDFDLCFGREEQLDFNLNILPLVTDSLSEQKMFEIARLISPLIEDPEQGSSSDNSNKEKESTCKLDSFVEVKEDVNLEGFLKFNQKYFGQKFDLPANAKVFFHSDIHASVKPMVQSINDLIKKGYLGHDFKIIDKNFYMVFSGDYTDRGCEGVESICTILKLKQANPERVFMLRGNHEDVNQNIREKNNSFFDELKERFGFDNETAYIYLEKMYKTMPSVLLLGFPTGVENEYKYIQFGHGAFDPRFDPRDLMKYGKSKNIYQECKMGPIDDSRVNWLGKNFYSKFLEPLKKLDYDGKSFENVNLLLWGDWFAYTEEGPEFHSKSGRYVLSYDQAEQYVKTCKIDTCIDGEHICELEAIIGGHQHSGDIFTKMIDRGGLYNHGNPYFTYSYRPYGFSERSIDLDKRFPVWTFNVSPGPAFVSVNAEYFYDTYAIIEMNEGGKLSMQVSNVPVE